MKIVFFVGTSWHPWNPKTIAETGCGGSEIACATMAQHLASFGHDVFVYNDCGTEGTYRHVEYLHHSKFHHLTGDLLIASRTPGAVDECHQNYFSRNVLWVHDCHMYQSHTPERAAKFDVTLCLTNWHKHFFQSYYPFAKNIQLTSNGLDTRLYRRNDLPRDAHKMIWSSSPNRGLQHLVAMMPKIRRQVPDATLDVYYGWSNWETTLKTKQNDQEYLEMRLIRGLAESTSGVTLKGRVSPTQLSEAQLGAGVWAYSTQWHETSCITCMEASCSGMIPIASNLAALSETMHGFGSLINGDAETIGYQNQMVQHVIEAMNNPPNRMPMMEYAQDNFDWELVLHQWRRDLEIEC